jgi:hypothetical protein
MTVAELIDKLMVLDLDASVYVLESHEEPNYSFLLCEPEITVSKDGVVALSSEWQSGCTERAGLA